MGATIHFFWWKSSSCYCLWYQPVLMLVALAMHAHVRVTASMVKGLVTIKRC